MVDTIELTKIEERKNIKADIRRRVKYVTNPTLISFVDLERYMITSTERTFLNT